jgi:hypothetical protein
MSGSKVISQPVPCDAYCGVHTKLQHACKCAVALVLLTRHNSCDAIDPRARCLSVKAVQVNCNCSLLQFNSLSQAPHYIPAEVKRCQRMADALALILYLQLCSEL